MHPPGVEGVRSLTPDEQQEFELTATQEAPPSAAPVPLGVLDGGVIDLQPNIIKGTVRFTNENPDILAFFAADPWHSDGEASASSTSPSGYSASTTTVKYKSPSEFTFEMYVEAAAGGEAGVVYDVEAYRGRYYHRFSRSNVTVRPKNYGPAEVELTRCVGAVEIQIGTDDTCTTPAQVSGLEVGGLRTFSTAANSVAGYVEPVSSRDTYISYHVRTEHGWLWHSLPVAWANVGCDQLVRICKAVVIPPPPEEPPPPPPPPPPLPTGAITGPFEVLNETPSPSLQWHIWADYGPRGDYAHQSVVPPAPVVDSSKWWMLSDLNAGNYYMYGIGTLRKGRQFTRFETQWIYPVTVVADQTTPVTRVVEGETRYPFSMEPAYFQGSIRLADPYTYAPAAGDPSSFLRSLYFEGDYDSNGDGVPDDTNIDETRLLAQGSGKSVTAFNGTFDDRSKELKTNYSQVLPTPYDVPSTWRQEPLKLRFWSEGQSFITRPDLYNEKHFINGVLNLTTQAERSATLAKGESFEIDHEYCFNGVRYVMQTGLGRFYNPLLNVSGSYSGLDWMERQTAYSVDGFFYGSPFISSGSSHQYKDYAKPSGLMHVALPQGTYTLRPSANMVNEAGDVNSANFAPVNLELGCGQFVVIVPPLTVEVNPVDRCATSKSVLVTGVVKSSSVPVERIWYQLNGGPEVTLCTHCGSDPAFSFSVELSDCENTVRVFAFNEGMRMPSSSSQQLVWDDPADGATCAGAYCVNRPPVARCHNISVPANETCSGSDDSAETSVNNGSYDPDTGDTFTCVQTPGGPYVPGSQQVTLTCTDSAGLSSSCEATVTVEDKRPPTIVCPEPPPELECRDGGAQASFATPVFSDNCGSVTATCTPASGSTFPVGTTATVCTAQDGAGNRASCQLNVTVVDSTPPEVSCPAPFTLECTGAPVTLPTATATDVCAVASVSGPTKTTFPVGTSPLTYTAKDKGGHEATCSSSITVTDTQPPTLTLKGSNRVALECYADYAEPGATASDICQGDLSAQVRITGSVNTRLPGRYTLTYSVEDSAGNSAVPTTRVVDVTGPVNCCMPNSGHFISTGSLPGPRPLHTTTLLKNGHVLVTGGYWINSELYDPSAGVWRATGNTLTTHRYHTATLLNDGRVLIAGSTDPTITSEVYDPSTGKWGSTGPMATLRYHHTATLLPDGKVLVVGGSTGEYGGTVLASAEVYDPATGTWSSTGGMSVGRRDHTATLLPNGKVLVVGGSDAENGGTLMTSAEVYDPATGTWSSTGSMSVGRHHHAAVLLAQGKVLVSGGAGDDGARSTTAELYDPATGTWSSTGSMITPRRYHSLTLLPDGRVLVVGGYHSNAQILAAAELYDPELGTWCPTGSMAVPRYNHTATLLPDSGGVLITAGTSNGDQSSCELYVLPE
jgi:hypothetical protein